MERLYRGVKKFQETCFPGDRENFKRLAHGQSPDVLFITCCDSRVDPNLITQSKPGQLFVARTVGNIVPTCSTPWQKTSIASAVEFALMVLNVSDVVVCGHSDCGAVKALTKDEKELADMPYLKEWLDVARPVKDTLTNISTPSFEKRLEKAIKEHVLAQLENLKTYAPIDKGLKSESINIHGWYYDIPSGGVERYDRIKHDFIEITSSEPSAKELEERKPADEAR